MAVRSIRTSSVGNGQPRYGEMTIPPVLFKTDFLVVAGGGAGGRQVAASGVRSRGCGGGAGGYRTSEPGETSGGGFSEETPMMLKKGDNFVMRIGAGGPANSGDGFSSFFGPIYCEGGGGGASGRRTDSPGTGRPGGSGGGGGSGAIAQGIPRQGFNGGLNTSGGGNPPGAPGGGAGGVATSTVRGPGLTSSIDGTPALRGLGGVNNSSGSPAGESNTGNGGPGASGDNASGKNGGSGVIILKYPVGMSLDIDPGLVSSTDTTTFPGFRVTTFTAGIGVVTVQ